MTPADPCYILTSECEGVLAGWVGPVVVRDGMGEETAVVVLDGVIVGASGEWRPGHTDVTVLLDAGRPEVRDRLARWLAGRLGVECGTTAPMFRVVVEDGVLFAYLTAGDGWTHWFTAAPSGEWYTQGLADIPLDSPDRDVLALLAVCRAVGRLT